MRNSLKAKTVKGVTWSLIDNIANSGITFLVGLVLARLLTPAEYGILAMVTIFIAISNSIIDCGFSSALVRKVEVKSIDLNTVFYFNLVISLILYFILFISAPYLSIFFKEPLLTSITRVLGVVLLINAFAIIQRTIFVRKVDFKTQTKISFISSISSGGVGIGMALAGYGAWSIVGQQILRQLLNTVLLWIYGKWYPIWEFSKKSFQELFSFGSKILLSGLIDAIYQNIFYFIIGRFYSSASLGQYTRATQFSSIFSSNLSSVVQRVSYPVLSSIQDDTFRLKQAYRKIIQSTMLVAFICMLGLAAVAKPLIIILIGEKWLPAAYYLQILCFSSMLYPLQAINLNILQVKGRSDLFLKLEIIKKCIAIIPIMLGIFIGIEYMLWCWVLTSVISLFLNSYYSASLINYSTIEQIKDILPSFLTSSLVSFTMWSITLLDISVYFIFPLQCMLGLSLILLMCEKLRRSEYLEIKQVILFQLKKIK